MILQVGDLSLTIKLMKAYEVLKKDLQNEGWSEKVNNDVIKNIIFIRGDYELIIDTLRLNYYVLTNGSTIFKDSEHTNILISIHEYFVEYKHIFNINNFWYKKDYLNKFLKNIKELQVKYNIYISLYIHLQQLYISDYNLEVVTKINELMFFYKYLLQF